MKKLYYKGLNSFVVRQISSKVNTTVFSMTVICLMLFITICVLSSALSIKNSMTSNLKTLVPTDIQFTKKWNLKEEDIQNSWKYNANMIEDSNITLRETLENFDFNIEENLKDIVEFDIYASNQILMKDTLGDYYEEASKKYPLMDFDSSEMFIGISDYNALARLYGKEEYTLEDDEYILVADYKEVANIRNEALKRNTPIVIDGKKYYPKFKQYKEGFLFMISTHANAGFFILPNDAVFTLSKEESVMNANYKAKTDEEKEKIEKLVVEDMTNHPYIDKTSLEAATKIHLYESSVGLGAMVTFIGLYLGIIFLISSAAILALKELSESTDNKERYHILRKIGTDEKMISKALLKQIAVFFLFPLLIAMIHSIFGIMFCNFILSTFGNEQLLPSIIMTSIFIVIIYGGYFIITYLCSKNIIKERY